MVVVEEEEEEEDDKIMLRTSARDGNHCSQN
jgi:hypothetical protein